MAEQNYIIINLNQTISKAQLQEHKLERNRWILFGAITLIFCALGFFSYKISSDIMKLKNERITTIEKIKKDTALLHKEGQIDISKKDIERLNNLNKKQILWAPKLRALADITPEHMAVTELEFKNEKLIISAISKLFEGEKEFKVIDDFIDLLKSTNEFSKDFKTITFYNSERIRSKGQEMLAFKVIALNKKQQVRRK